MPNAFWYVMLALSALTPFVYALWKVRDKKIIATYSFLGGITFIAEYVVFTLLHSYEYMPHILDRNYFDDVMGAFFSDAFVIPMTGSVVAAFQLRFRSICLVAVIIGLIEELFLTLGLYRHIWWRTLFTVVGAVLWFVVAKRLYPLLHRRMPGLLHALLIYLASTFVHASIVFFVVALFGAYRYQVGWFQDQTRGHVAFATTYILGWGLIFTPLVVFRLRWGWRILVLLLTLPADWLLWRSGILHLTPRWSLFHFLVMRLAVLFVLDAYNRFILDHNRPPEIAG
ncbi:MAG: hypothetical protein ACM3XM_16335 [Mycobacterium leprae]